MRDRHKSTRHTPPADWDKYTKSNPYKMPYTAIEEDFKPVEWTPFNEYNHTAEDIKDIVYNELTKTERRIFLLYAYYGNALRVASILNTPAGKFYAELRQLKKKILDLYHERTDDSRRHRHSG